ncbi:MAG TPA: AAA family ATPase [Candidatus Limnocylindria bacterium]|nr:AAA family ATPase [Candidatus Limnocylindria bacterium]
MKLAVAGKGGAGKTTISATLARSLARAGRTVLAIDGDPNANLGIALGVPAADLERQPRVPRDLLEQRDGDAWLKVPADQLRRDYAIAAPDGVQLMAVTTVDHAGTG